MLRLMMAATAACFLFQSPGVQADPDPCNFNDGSTAFSWQRVMECYNSVPFNHDDLENAVEFILAARERSDQREIFDNWYGWRQSTAALDNPNTVEDYPSDFAMQLAIVGNHKEFLNPHWRYTRPGCYTRFLGAFIPFDFGSDVERVKKGKPEQVFFIEDAPFLPELYQDFTGIDAREFIGMRILAINGEQPAVYFREWGREVLRRDENDGAQLNEILGHGAYSLRVSVNHDLPPAQATVVFELQAANGRLQTVEMPWVFAPRAEFGLSQWSLDRSESSAEFIAECTVPSFTYYFYGGANNAAAAPADSAVVGMDRQNPNEDIIEKRNAVANLYKKNGRAEYFEVPPGRKGQTLETIVPHNDSAEVQALGDRATIIHLDDFVGDWKDEVIAGTEHACANTDRLVLDMRGNGGGYIENIDWLASHLFPDRTRPVEYSLFGRFLGAHPGRNELTERMGQAVQDFWYPAYGWDCVYGYEAACYVDIQTNTPLTGLDWNAVNTVVEARGGVLEVLSPMAGFRNSGGGYAAGSDSIACPGKFEDDTLIILSDGTGASAGFFFPEVIRDQAVVVTMGGFVGESVVSGIARGGAVWPMNYFESLAEQELAYAFPNGGYGPPTDPLPILRRDAEVYIEQPAAYLRDETRLYVEQAPVGDRHVDVWANSPASDGYVYDRVVNAVQKRKGKK